ncbi:MAG: DUF4129 domain-containing protein [Pyrinomonadaceae bacterium]
MPKLLHILPLRFAPFYLMALGVIILCSVSVQAISLVQYRQNVHRAAIALDALQSSEVKERAISQFAVLREVRNLLPANQKIEIGNGETFEADNAWLETSLRDYENAPAATPATERTRFLQAAAERLGAIEDRLKELESAQSVAKTNNADKQKLDEILRRPEFQKPTQEKEKSVLESWLDALVKWLNSFSRRQQPSEVETPHVDLSSLGTILNYLVIGLALAIIGFVVWRFLLPLIGNTRGRQKPKKKEPRIILGETLLPDATADDLLSQADRLAQSGELRAAIRKGYIAALCDLSDRKVLGLARHKTNRDYLRDVSKREEIYQPMSSMTGTFERHWYGDVPAEIEDWQTFRLKYGEIVQSAKRKVNSPNSDN